MSRSLITKWEELAKAHCEGDRLSVFVRDGKTGRMKLIDCRISAVHFEGEAEFNEEATNWPQLWRERKAT